MRYLLFVILCFCSISSRAQITQVGLVGPAATGSWDEEVALIQAEDNPDIWKITLHLDEGEVKFRANRNWSINWGGVDFPTGKGNQDGNNIPVFEGEYDISINTKTGLYNFQILGSGNGKVDATDAAHPPRVRIETNGKSVNSGALISFWARSLGEVKSYQWYFEGGFPNESVEAVPLVRYELPGAYNVRLIASNEYGADTLDLSDYIVVSPREVGATDWWNETVFYEIFVRSFYDSDGDGIGDFNGLTEKLDYLNDGNPETTDDLGITGIWLMPINPSPTYHGYDVSDYKDINPDFGTREDFQRFLEAAHARGIKVIIDYVMNHSSSKHPWFLESAKGPDSDKRNWYIWDDPNGGPADGYSMHVYNDEESYYGIFSSGMPDLNYQEPAVKLAMFDISTFWLQNIGVDGFRLDAVKYLEEEDGKLENSEATFQLLKDFRAHYKSVNPNAFAVGEAWTSTDMILNYVEDAGLDYCFEFDLSFALNRGLKSGDAQPISRQLQKAYNVYPHLQFGTFLTNHDQTRIIDALDYDFNKAKVGASIYLTAPGIPYLYYGEEIGQQGKKPDQFIRTPMQWTDRPQAGFTSGTPWIAINPNYQEINVSQEELDPNSLLTHYKRLIRIRNHEAVLRLGTFQTIPTNQETVVAFYREFEGEQIIVLVNIGAAPISTLNLDLSRTPLTKGKYKVMELMTHATLKLKVDKLLQMNELQIDGYETMILKVGS
ncbi:MAG: PKD domain-containing protein [Saprospiraceae bacterium]|nr:PKD domain-containing protein [Saprospiraceae bacterium]